MEYRVTPGRVEIGKFSLYYERVGAGPAMVFLHGLGGNHLSWWQQVPYFMRSFDCITVDQRSFGLSPDPDGLFNRAHSSDLARPARPSQDRSRDADRTIDGRMDDRGLRTRASRARRRDGDGGYARRNLHARDAVQRASRAAAGGREPADRIVADLRRRLFRAANPRWRFSTKRCGSWRAASRRCGCAASSGCATISTP